MRLGKASIWIEVRCRAAPVRSGKFVGKTALKRWVKIFELEYGAGFELKYGLVSRPGRAVGLN